MNANELIEIHIPFALKIASLKRRIMPSFVSSDEIRSAALMGLTLAANNYNSSKGSFSTYAFLRINGEIKDYLREISWGGRSRRTRFCSLDGLSIAI